MKNLHVLQIISEEDSVEILFKDLSLATNAFVAFVANSLHEPYSGLKEVLLIADAGRIIGQHKQ